MNKQKSPLASQLFGIGLAVVVSLPGLPTPSPAEDSETAVLIMAHGGSATWNHTVKKAVQKADIPYPTRIFFGMGDMPHEQRELQDEVEALEEKGAHTIVVIPMLISSYSEVARQWKYLLGVGVQPGFNNVPLFPIEKHATIRFMEPLNDSAVVAEILLDRAHEISSDPAKESVIIVAHGPNDDTDNARWHEVIQNVGNRVKDRGGFKTVEGFTLRDDAPTSVRSQAIEELRKRIEAINRTGDRALVISLLLAPGGIEHKIELELRGLSYAFNTKTLLPDSRISEWIRSQIP